MTLRLLYYSSVLHRSVLPRLGRPLLLKHCFSTKSRALSSVPSIRVKDFGGPEQLEHSSSDIPAPTEAGQLIVRIEACGINPSDTYIVKGPLGPYKANPSLLPELPFTPGKDAAGVVETVAEGCRFAVGDRVYLSNSITGSMARAALCHEDTVWRLPPNVSFSQAQT